MRRNANRMFVQAVVVSLAAISEAETVHGSGSSGGGRLRATAAAAAVVVMAAADAAAARAEAATGGYNRDRDAASVEQKVAAKHAVHVHLLTNK